MKLRKNHSEASRGVLKCWRTIYNCINVAVGECIYQYVTALYGASGAAVTFCTTSSDFQNFTGHNCSTCFYVIDF